jgi:hypothetical protein
MSLSPEMFWADPQVMGAFGASAETAPWDKARAARMAKQRVRKDGMVFMGDIEFSVFSVEPEA